MMGYFLGSVNDGSAKGKRTAYLLNKLAQEAVNEMAEVPPEMVEFYFKRAAAVMYWSATGERVLGMPMPDDFVPPAELGASNEQLALPSAEELLAASNEVLGLAHAGQAGEMAALEARDRDE
jgi:hypothetical protein